MPPALAEVEIIDKSTAYQGHYRVDRYRLRHTLFAGGWGREIGREVLERGHAVAVLPYDPGADAVVLIEQFRIGAYLHGGDSPWHGGGDSPWLLEIVAGLFDADEGPEEVARREAAEEAGLELGELVPVAALATGRVRNSPALVALQWLALNREDLRARWG